MVEEAKPGGRTPRGARYELLLDQAVPELYRLNAFRVTQLPLNATQREVSRQVEKIRMAEKLDVAIELSGGFLPLSPAPDAEALRAAAQRLRDPEKRLIDELFWFWPLEDDTETDAPLQALRTEGAEAARALWQTAQEKGGRRGAIALHNLAILDHVLVLDAELDERAGTPSDAQRFELSALWSSAYQRWDQLRKSAAFWKAVRGRVQEIDDPRLDDAAVAGLRKTLPEALAVVSARLAVSQFDAGQMDACQRIFASLWESGFPQSFVKQAIRTALEPVRARLKTICETAEKIPYEDAATVKRGLDTLLAQAEPLLASVDLALPEGDATRQGLHDDVASQARAMAIYYGNETEDWEVSLSLMRKAARLAEGEALSDRIADDIQTGTGNAYLKEQVRRAGSVRRFKKLGCAGSVGIILLVILISWASARGGCGGSDSSSSDSAWTSADSGSQSASDSSTPESTPAAPSVDYMEIYELVKAMIKYGNSLPNTADGPNEKAAKGTLKHAASIRRWLRANEDADAATRRLCDNAIAMAKAEAAYWRNPASQDNVKRVNGNIELFNEVWNEWLESH